SPPTSAEHWNSVVTGTSWTPMAGSWTGIKPYNSSVPVAFDLLKNLVTGHSYCIRVRAVGKASTLTGQPAYGDYTYLPGGPNDDGTPAFTFTGYPAGGACSPSCSPGYLGANDYLEPITGTTSTMTPLFTWNPVAGAQSYYVLVAKDPNFTTVIDYALTRDPAYSPRTF